MNTEELSNRLTQILTGITSGEPNSNIIQGFVQNFIEDFKPESPKMLSTLNLSTKLELLSDRDIFELVKI